jgi:hypothetical protein
MNTAGRKRSPDGSGIKGDIKVGVNIAHSIGRTFFYTE